MRLHRQPFVKHACLTAAAVLATLTLLDLQPIAARSSRDLAMLSQRSCSTTPFPALADLTVHGPPPLLT